MFSRHSRRRQDSLELRDIQPEDSHAQCESDGGEEEEILCLLVEGGWMLENGEAAGADCEEGEPLPVGTED